MTRPRILSDGLVIPASPSSAVREPVPPATPLSPHGWWFDIVLVALLTVMTAALIVDSSLLLALDVKADQLSETYRVSGAPREVAKWLERLGQGGPLALLCLALSIYHARRQRSLEALLPVSVAYLVSYGSIGTIKVLTDREMPNKGPVELFSDPEALAYPSGHASNTILWYGLLAMLLAPLVWPWVCALLRWFPPFAVGFTTVYLHHHWVTDVIAGLFIGILVLRLVRRRPWRWLHVPWLSDRLGLTPRPSPGEALAAPNAQAVAAGPPGRRG